MIERRTNIMFDDGRELLVETTFKKYVKKFVTYVYEEGRRVLYKTSLDDMHDYVVEYVSMFSS